MVGLDFCGTGVEVGQEDCDKEAPGVRQVTLRAREGRLETGVCPEGTSLFKKDAKVSLPMLGNVKRMRALTFSSDGVAFLGLSHSFCAGMFIPCLVGCVILGTKWTKQ